MSTGGFGQAEWSPCMSYNQYLAQSGASVKSDEEEFVRVLEGRAKDGNKLKIVDVGRNEKEVEVKEIKVRR